MDKKQALEETMKAMDRYLKPYGLDWARVEGTLDALHKDITAILDGLEESVKKE